MLAAAAASWPASATQPDADETPAAARQTLGSGAPTSGAAQPDADETAVDALRCWRRVSRGAVYAGERFTMTVTCRLVETDAARTRLDETALEPATLDVAPFEVLSGERFDDVPAGPWRFSQRDYALRLIPETGFGQDVEIPPLDLTYRIERRIEGEPALAGRELAYVLPAEPIRLLSLVPETADDIRDLPPAGFGAVQARDLRARLLALAAALFGVAAVGLALLGAVHAVRARRGAAAPSERRLSPALVAHRALDELLRVRRAVTGGGWTPDAAARALTALRIAGAVALSRPVAQTATAAGEAPRDGQLRVRHGLLGRRTAVISAALTSADGRAPRRAGLLAEADAAADLGRAMTMLTAFRYRRGGEAAAPALDPDALTRALDAAIARVARLRWRALAPVRRARGWADAARREWTRLTGEAPWKR